MDNLEFAALSLPLSYNELMYVFVSPRTLSAWKHYTKGQCLSMNENTMTSDDTASSGVREKKLVRSYFTLRYPGH